MAAHNTPDLAAQIGDALSGDGPIPRERVLSWLDVVADSDLLTLAKLYRLTDEAYYRIQPELGSEATCALIQRYLLGCIRDGVTDSEEIHERYEAAMSLHVWFRHLLRTGGRGAILAQAASAVTSMYLASGDAVRDVIETGFLEHALETAALREYFSGWASDPRLQPAWERALEWGQAHPDYMEQLLKPLSEPDPT